MIRSATARPVPFARRRIAVLVAAALASGSVAALADPAGAPGRAVAVEVMRQLPISFERNDGQFATEVLFSTRGVAGSVSIRSGEVAIAPRGGASAPAFRFRLAGANLAPEALPLEPKATRSHYYRGGERSVRLENVPHFGRVELKDVYPGIDLALHGTQGELEYDFLVGVGANPADIRLNLAAADLAWVDEAGDLVVVAGGEVLRHKAPVAFQGEGESRVAVGARFEIQDLEAGAEATFALQGYDPTRPLVIDPFIGYSTYLGSSATDFTGVSAADPSGKVYIANTFAPSSSGATAGTISISKLDPATNQLLYTTYLGGSGSDFVNAIAIAPSGAGHAVYLTGATQSFNFPTCFAVNDCAPYGGGEDGFVSVLDENGVVIYSQYLGGSGADAGSAIAVGASGSGIYVAGRTSSDDFPVAGALYSSRQGSQDAFVTKLNTASGIVYSTYLGGSGSDAATGIAVDTAGNVHVTGNSSSLDYPVVNGVQAGVRGAFVTKIGASGGPIEYSTFLGGSASGGIAIAIDPSTQGAVVTGYTFDASFPQVGLIRAHGGSTDAFVTKLGASGGPITFSTLLGGSGGDSPAAIAVSPAGDIYLAGSTTSGNFPMISPLAAPGSASQSVLLGSSSAFVARIHLGAIDFSSYLGGSGTESVGSISLDAIGNAYVSGRTTAPNFPTVNPYRAVLQGDSDVFLTRISFFAFAYPPRLSDLNSDERSDILWRDDTGGLNYEWQMNGLAISGQGYLPSVASNWAVAGLGDADANRRADVLWRESGGLNYLWLMNGFAIGSQGYLPTVANPWVVIGMGDANDDARADVFWRNPTTGQNYLWLLNGLSITSQVFLPTVAGPDWETVGVADYSGDRKVDVLWRNKVTGQNYLWLMNGLTVGSQAYLPSVVPVDWEVVGSPDADGDGRADVLWRNKATGQNYLWLMNGLTISSQGYLPSVTDNNWKVVGYGDYNGDGRGDVLWRNAATGQNYLWTMNGISVATQGYLPSVAGANWHPVKR